MIKNRSVPPPTSSSRHQIVTSPCLFTLTKQGPPRVPYIFSLRISAGRRFAAAPSAQKTEGAPGKAFRSTSPSSHPHAPESPDALLCPAAIRFPLIPPHSQLAFRGRNFSYPRAEEP